MILIKIGEDERTLEEIDEQWINQQINRRKEAGQPVCVRVTIHENDVNLNLSTPNCANYGSIGGRPPNTQEKEIIDLWKERGLLQDSFTGGNLVAFLHQYRNRF